MPPSYFVRETAKFCEKYGLFQDKSAMRCDEAICTKEHRQTAEKLIIFS